MNKLEATGAMPQSEVESSESRNSDACKKSSKIVHCCKYYLTDFYFHDPTSKVECSSVAGHQQFLICLRCKQGCKITEHDMKVRPIYNCLVVMNMQSLSSLLL